MSCRHATPVITRTRAATALIPNLQSLIPRRAGSALVFNGRHLTRAERFEKLARAVDVELRVARLDAEEEPVAAGQREARNVEHRMKRLWEAVQRQHPEHRGKRSCENRRFER